jgi:hypothetical protein
MTPAEVVTLLARAGSPMPRLAERAERAFDTGGSTSSRFTKPREVKLGRGVLALKFWEDVAIIQSR